MRWPTIPLDQIPEIGRALNERVCKAFGIPGSSRYFAEAPGHDGNWFADHVRSEVERVIAEANARGERDWRYGSKLIELTFYPAVSQDLRLAWELCLAPLLAKGARVSVHNRAVGPWGCSILVDVGTPIEGHFFQYGTTPAHAICIAALDAVGAIDRPEQISYGSEGEDGTRVICGQAVL